MMSDRMDYPHCRSIIEKGLALNGFVVFDSSETEFSIKHSDSAKVLRVKVDDLRKDEFYHQKLQRLLRLYAETTDTN